MSTVEIKLDDDLLALIDERAAASGKARDVRLAIPEQKTYRNS